MGRRKKPAYERKWCWVKNEDEIIRKRIRWMEQRGWQLCELELSSSTPNEMALKFRRRLQAEKNKASWEPILAKEIEL
ncbi:MAG TPA: hypothetical protein VFA10_30110 [Ktedonobacteraceae bacterium]|nr:hypothetical protein [Ktedonobacteraceae bacterium]